MDAMTTISWITVLDAHKNDRIWLVDHALLDPVNKPNLVEIKFQISCIVRSGE